MSPPGGAGSSRPGTGEPPRPGSSTARRYLSLAIWAAVLLAPSVPVAVAILVAAGAVSFGPDLWRLHRRHRAARAARAAHPARETGGRSADPVLLGRDPDGRPVVLSDAQLAAHGLIVGASGSGKSTTMLTLLAAHIRAGTPVVAIDLKGSPAFAATLRTAAAAAGRELRVWSPDGPGHWNPLAHGNPTALKDKLIGTERFTEPHYKRAAERYVQAAIGVLQAARSQRPVHLEEVVAVMEPRRLAAMLRGVPGERAERVQDYLAGLSGDQISAVHGLGTRLALLSESCAGPYLRPDPHDPARTIDLRAALAGGDPVLFSLNSSVYGTLAAQLGALAIQDIVSATGGRLADGTPPPPAIVAVDEFSALDGDHLLALLSRGREFGTRTLVATQEMADLDGVRRGFLDQVVGIVGVKIIHRQDVPASAALVARMFGTEFYWEETEHVRGAFSGSGGTRGTRRLAERPVVHPNEIMTLPPGHAILQTKLPVAAVRRVHVIPPPAAPAAPPPAPRRPTVSPPARPGPTVSPPARPGPTVSPAAGADPPAPGRARARPASPNRSPRTGRGRDDRDYPAPGVTR